MSPHTFKKLALDFIMAILLLLLMTYELIGRATHEWLETGMFLLVSIHHIFNHRWSKAVFKGRYTPYRIMQTVLVALLVLCMLGTMISGIILSRYVFDFLPIQGGRSFARNLHMISAYGGFVLMTVHLGLHWGMVMTIVNRHIKKPSAIRKWILRGFALLIAGYGAYAFINRNLFSYMMLEEQFVFFNYEEPIIRFLADCFSIMCLLGCVAHYMRKYLKVQFCGDFMGNLMSFRLKAASLCFASARRR